VNCLDDAIGLSQNLKLRAPIRLIAIGGFLAVGYLGTREFTQQLHYLLDPTIDCYDKIAAKLAKAIGQVASVRGYPAKWATDDVGIYCAGVARDRLFRASLTQSERIHQGKYLHVYAVQ
jgi:hypothetical protein